MTNRHSPLPTHARYVSVMDTTLRDGEQTPQVAYTPQEKLQIARQLLELVGVDWIEVASSRVSEGEQDATRAIVDWARDAGMLQRVAVLGFCDGRLSARWAAKAGVQIVNLLAKGAEKHCRKQLRCRPEEHFARMVETVAAVREQGLEIGGVYLEDWSRGVVDSPSYVDTLLGRLSEAGVLRVFLADTLGCLQPEQVRQHIAATLHKFDNLYVEFHGHNDYGLATANCLAAVQAGARGVHVTVNGLGERAGNARLAEVVVALRDHLSVQTSVDEGRLIDVSTLVQSFSGKPIADNSPILGRDVFTQTAGVHADGDEKAGLYESELRPERFARTRDYALGKLAGKASLNQNLLQLGIQLDEEQKRRLLQRIVELGDRKKPVHREDLPFLVSDLLEQPNRPWVYLADYEVRVGKSYDARARVEVVIGDQRLQAEHSGNGGYDALMRAVESAASQVGLELPKLEDFRVRIPPGGTTSALVETTIRWRDTRDGLGAFTTVGVDCDQIGAAVSATDKMLQLIAQRD
ncbi:MAG: 2-isopropylmalate synthase [Proteobacteria bacterium]|nr:2-isopropylmalate synthase [Pseudomonadota bacterium]